MDLSLAAAVAAVLVRVSDIDYPVVVNQVVTGILVMLQAALAVDEVVQIILQVVRVALPVAISGRIQLVIPVTPEQLLALALVELANGMLAEALPPVVVEVISVRPVAQASVVPADVEQIYMAERNKRAVLLALLCLETVILLGLIRVQDMGQFLKRRKNEY
jgi:hypothetical protein